MSPRSTPATARRWIAASVGATVALVAATAAPAAAPPPPAPSVVSAITSPGAPTGAEISRTAATGSDAEVASLLRRLGLVPTATAREVANGLPSLLATLESLRQSVTSLQLPVLGSTVDGFLRELIDTLAARGGVASPAANTIYDPVPPAVLFPAAPPSGPSTPPTPVPVPQPFVARATVARVTTTGSRRRLRVAARCPSASAVACETVVTGTIAGRPAFTRKRVTIDPGATYAFTVALSGTTARRLARAAATVRLTATTAGANPGAVTRSVRVPRTR